MLIPEVWSDFAFCSKEFFSFHLVVYNILYQYRYGTPIFFYYATQQFDRKILLIQDFAGATEQITNNIIQ